MKQTVQQSDSEDEQYSEPENEVVQTGPKIMDFTFTPEKIMSLMSKKLLKKMQIRWENADGGGLNYTEFCQLMLRRIKTLNDDEKYELLYGSYKLFQEIDINDDKNMEWDEFTQYIVNAVTKSNIQSGEGMPSVREQLIALKAQKFKNFAKAKKPLDKSNHFNVINQALECKATNNIICFERFGKELKFYDKSMGLQKKISVPLVNAFIASIAYDDKNQIYACTTTDKKIYFYKQGKVKMEGPRIIECSCDKSKSVICSCAMSTIQTKIWFCPKQEFWITAGSDFKVRHWSYEKCKFLQELDYGKHRHTDEVTSCVEIQSSMYNAIATSSLDQTITLFDVEHGQRLSTIENEHEKGIKKLRYQFENGGLMISIGNEIYANVWAPESMKSDMHQGRLVGHKKPIVDGQFINKAPFFVTMDDINMIFIWDTKTLTAVQSFPGRLQSNITGLVIISNNCFWAYGKRFFQYDTFQDDGNMIEQAEDGEENTIEEETYPLSAYINEYMFWQVVVKQKEIRMYDLTDGKLISIYNEVFGEQNTSDDITKFKIDKKHRKAYVASNTGRVYVINCQNGVLLKKVTQYQENLELMKEQGLLKTTESFVSLGSSNYESEKEQKGENWMFEDEPQKKKKKKKGKDKNEQENQFKESKGEFVYSEKSEEGGELYKVNTNDNPEINDLILVWEDYRDQEIIMMICTNQKEYFVYDEQDPDPEKTQLLRRVTGGHEEEITILAFNYHLSLVATGCINGEIALYDFEMSRLEGLLLGHTGDITALEFLEGYPLLISASMDNSVCIWGVRGCPKKYQNVCVKRFQNLSWNGGTDAPTTVTRLLVWNDNMPGIKKYRRHREKVLAAPTHRKFEYNFVFAFKDVETIWKEEIMPTLMTVDQKRSDAQKFQDVLASETYQSLLADEKSKLFITAGENQDDYNDHLEEEFNRIYLYLGDTEGYIKIWNLTDIIKNIGIDKCQGMRDGNRAYNPYRQERIDCSEMAHQIRMSNDLDEQIQKLPMAIDPNMNGLLIREAKAHQDQITDLNKIKLQDIEGIISSSKDQKVRNWSLGLDLVGNLNQKTDKEDPKWQFQSNHKKEKQERELAEVEEIIDEIIDMQAKAKEEEVFDNERRKLKVDYDKKVEVKQVSHKARQNWQDLEEEKLRQEKEMEELKARQRRDREYENARSNLIINKIERSTAEIEIKLNQVQMTFPNELPEGKARDLQTHLNNRQMKIIEGDRDRIKEARMALEMQEQQHTLTLTKKMSKLSKTKSVLPQISKVPSELKKEFSGGESIINPLSKEDTILGKDNSKKNLSPQFDKRKSKKYIAPPPKQKQININELVEQRREETKFDNSKEDKNNIIEHKNIPKLRNKLESLKIKDRFQSKEREHESPRQMKGLSDYLEKIEKMQKQRTSQKVYTRNYVSKTGISNNIRFTNEDQRPFSIADSEIQKVSDHGLYKDVSTISLGTTYDPPMHNLESGQIDLSGLKKRMSQAPRNVQPLASLAKISQTQNQSYQSPTGTISNKPKKRGSTFKKNQFMSVMNDGKRVFIEKKDFLSPTISRERILQVDDADLKISLPKGSQGGHGVPKVISRNPVNLGQPFVSEDINQKSKKKDVFINIENDSNVITSKHARSPSTKRFTMTNDYSNSNVNQFTEDKTEEYNYNTIDNTRSQHKLNKQRGIGSLPAINRNQPSFSNFEIGGDSSPKLGAVQSMILNNELSQVGINRNLSGVNRVVSHKSFSPRDVVRSQKFQVLKDKYFGNNSKLIQERLKNKDRLESVKTAMINLKKTYKTKTINMDT